MRLTKHAHACVGIEKDGEVLLIDPGNFTPDAKELLAKTNTVLITHEHPDHFNEDLLASSLDTRPELQVFGPAAVVDRWSARPGQITAVRDGDRFSAAGFEVAVHGDLHASIHPDIPQVANVGYLIEGSIYHPGDAYYAPPSEIRTLLLPTSGPWTKLSEAVDFVRATEPTLVIQIHELLLSELGQQMTARFFSPDMLSTVPLTILPIGDGVDV